jgi:hypothetical protein
MATKLSCFVVRPIHNRSDFVVALYVRPACGDRFEVIASGSGTSTSTITEDVFRHLNDDPLVLAYLGSPTRMEGEGNKWFWNPNVMLEAGYRMGLKKPIVFLRDHRRNEDEPLLPFDLANLQVVELPTEKDDQVTVYRDRAVDQIKQFAEAHMKAKCDATFAWPAITISFEGKVGQVRSASDDAAELFGLANEESLVGMQLSTFLDRVYARLMPGQRDAFQEEQKRLIGELYIGEKPMATVCLVFANEDISPAGKIEAAYLPIVARFVTQGAATILDVIYVDVTAMARLDEDGVVRCNLGCKKGYPHEFPSHSI